MAISDVVMRLIDRSGMNIKDASRAMGLKYTTLYSIISRKSERTDIHTLKIISDYFHEDLEIFCEEPGYTPRPVLSGEEKAVIRQFRELDASHRREFLGWLDAPEPGYTAEEKELVTRFRELNDVGRGKAMGEVGDLGEVPKYRR